MDEARLKLFTPRIYRFAAISSIRVDDETDVGFSLVTIGGLNITCVTSIYHGWATAVNNVTSMSSEQDWYVIRS